MTSQLQRNERNSQQETDNPFYVPDEYEIFKMKEKEKQIKLEERIKFQNLRVHEKGIKQKGKLTIRQINELGEDEENSDKEYNAKINIIDAADNAVKNRVRQKEPMYQFIEKKRDMLLFQMLIDHKRGMIDEFEKLTKLHRLGLEKSEQLIEEDIEMFNKFLEANKMSSRDAIKDAERETKLKQEKNQEIKSLQDHRTDLTTKNQQKMDNLEDLLKYKKFLDKITPKEFQRKSKKQNIQQQQQTSNKGQNISNQINFELQQLLNDSDDEELTYFTQPEQLEEIFTQLEEKNLFLMANTKEREQMVEDLKNKSLQRTKVLEDKINAATQTKNELIKQIDLVNEQIKSTKVIKNDSNNFPPLDDLQAQIQKIYKNDVIGNNEARQQLGGLEMLKETEKLIDQKLEEIKYFKSKAPDLVLEKEKNQNKLRSNLAKQMKHEQELIEQQKKQEEQQLVQTVHKRIGRPIMIRSWPAQVQVEEQVVDDITEEEKERIKYFT